MRNKVRHLRRLKEQVRRNKMAFLMNPLVIILRPILMATFLHVKKKGTLLTCLVYWQQMNVT